MAITVKDITEKIRENIKQEYSKKRPRCGAATFNSQEGKISALNDVLNFILTKETN